MEKLEKPKIEKDKELIIDIEIDEETEKEIFEKYEDLKFLIESIGMEQEELTEEEIEEGIEQAPEGAGFSLDPDSLGLQIEDPEEYKRVEKVILKNSFKQIGFDPENPKLLKEKEEETEERKFTIKYFEVENPKLILSFDGTYWVIENKKDVGF